MPGLWTVPRATDRKEGILHRCVSVHVLLLLAEGLDRIRTQLVTEALLRLGNRASLTSWIICFFDLRNQVMDKTESYDLYPSILPRDESDGTDLEGNLQARLQNEAFHVLGNMIDRLCDLINNLSAPSCKAFLEDNGYYSCFNGIYTVFA